MTVNIVDESGDSSSVGGGLSDLARLRKDAEAYEPKPLRYVHPTLSQYILVFRHDIDWEEMDKWRRKCITRPARNGREAEANQALFGRMVIAATNISIEHRGTGSDLTGTPVRDSRGVDVCFTNREFMAEFGGGTAADTVKAFIRSDPAIAALSAQIIDDNGVGQDVESLPDPSTDGGS